MRRKRVDANHAAVVETLRKAGWRVKDTSRYEHFVDLMAVKPGRLLFVEVKDGAKKPSARKLTPGEMSFVEFLNGLQCACCQPTAEYRIVESIEDAGKL